MTRTPGELDNVAMRTALKGARANLSIIIGYTDPAWATGGDLLYLKHHLPGYLPTWQAPAREPFSQKDYPLYATQAPPAVGLLIRQVTFAQDYLDPDLLEGAVQEAMVRFSSATAWWYETLPEPLKEKADLLDVMVVAGIVHQAGASHIDNDEGNGL
jgi:hypothetical protein